jgi:hypothetical protein
MSVPSVEEIETREQSILDQLPLEAKHVPKAETDQYDAELVEPFASNGKISCVGRLAIEPGTPLELKTCQEWIDCHSSGAGRRRGQFAVNESTHDALEQLGGVYVFLVMDGEQILAGRIRPPEDLDDIATWSPSSSRYSSRRAKIPWFKLVPKGVVEA